MPPVSDVLLVGRVFGQEVGARAWHQGQVALLVTGDETLPVRVVLGWIPETLWLLLLLLDLGGLLLPQEILERLRVLKVALSVWVELRRLLGKTMLIDEKVYKAFVVLMA